MNRRQRKKVNKKLEQLNPIEATPAIKAVEAVKVVRSLPPVKQLTAKELFESKLNSIYKGAVTPVTAYLNAHSTMVFKCSDCGVSFFGKGSHMLGKEHQRHVCNMPYGDYHGLRLATVPKRGDGVTRSRGKKKPKENGKKRAELFHEMIWNDHTPQEIAKTLQVNPAIIKNYFEREGLS